MDDDAEVTTAFSNRRNKGYVSIAEAESLGREIARRALSFSSKPDLVVGIANGALLITWVVSDELELPFEIVDVRRKGTRLKRRLVQIKEALRIPSAVVTSGPMATFWRLFEHTFYKFWPTQLEAATNELSFDVQGKNILLLDDCIVTGASVKFVYGQLVKAGARAVTVGVICISGDSPLRESDVGFPAMHISRLVHFYPWSVNHPDHDKYQRWLTLRNLQQRN
jgi:adenine/guanine phosphoribosyltransferase-like PRPP-binding protein